MNPPPGPLGVVPPPGPVRRALSLGPAAFAHLAMIVAGVAVGLATLWLVAGGGDRTGALAVTPVRTVWGAGYEWERLALAHGQGRGLTFPVPTATLEPDLCVGFTRPNLGGTDLAIHAFCAIDPPQLADNEVLAVHQESAGASQWLMLYLGGPVDRVEVDGEVSIWIRDRFVAILHPTGKPIEELRWRRTNGLWYQLSGTGVPADEA